MTAPAVLASASLLFGLVFSAVVFFALSNKKRPEARIVLFGALWFFLGLSVESSFIPIRDVIFEHRLYYPSVGFFFCLAGILPAIFHGKEPSRIILTILVLLLSLATWTRNWTWGSADALWEDVLRKYPANVRALNALGAYHKNEKNYELALSYLDRAVKANPRYTLTYMNLGDIAYMRKDYPAAIGWFTKLLEMDLTYSVRFDVMTSLAASYSDSGDQTRAVGLFQDIVRLYPDKAIAHVNLGRQYVKMNEADKAIEVLLRGTAIRETPQAYYQLHLAYKLKEDRANETLALQKALSLNAKQD